MTETREALANDALLKPRARATEVFGVTLWAP